MRPHARERAVSAGLLRVRHQLAAGGVRADYNVDEIVEWILARLGDDEPVAREGFRLAVVGKPNAGKSSIANRLLGEERMLVSDIAGTTVDAVEAQFQFGEHEYILADTAGLRRAGKQRDGVEVLSTFKTRDAIFKADLILLVIDGVVGPSNQDSRIIEQCLSAHKTIIVVANKTDLGKQQHEDFRAWFGRASSANSIFYKDIPWPSSAPRSGPGSRNFSERSRICARRWPSAFRPRT